MGGEGPLGFSMLPPCAAFFNDNMVVQAVAAPLRKSKAEGGAAAGETEGGLMNKK